MADAVDVKAAFDNPISDSFETEGSASAAGTQSFEDEAELADTTDMADLDHEKTDDELSDLTYAFQAMDVSNDGTIEPAELHAMMRVLGADITIEQVNKLYRECKKEFGDWVLAHTAGTVLPDFMHETRGGPGSTKHGGERHMTDLNIDRKNKQHPVFSRVRRLGKNPAIAYTVGAPITAANKIMSISYGMAKGAVPAFGPDATGTSCERRKRQPSE